MHLRTPLLVFGVALAGACSDGDIRPERDTEAENAESFTPVEEIRLDDTEGFFDDEIDVGEPPLPHDYDDISDEQWAAEDAKSDDEDELDAIAEVGDDEEDEDFEDVDLVYETGEQSADAAWQPMDGEISAPFSCKKRVYVDIQAMSGLPGAALDQRKDPAHSCWHPQRLKQQSAWRGCFHDGANEDDGGHNWYYDETNPQHAKGAEKGKVKACADTTPPRAPGVELMRHEGGWRLVQAPRVAAFIAQLFDDQDKEDINSLWYRATVYRKHPKLKKHLRVGPGINIGADRPLSKIKKEVFKVCKKLRSGQHLFLYSDAPLAGWDAAKTAKQQSTAAKRLAYVVKSLDRCTKRKVLDDGCFAQVNGCSSGQVCAWNGKGYCCRVPGEGDLPCMFDINCPGGEVCAETPYVDLAGNPQVKYTCMPPLCGKPAAAVSEEDDLRKCPFAVPKSDAGTRDITFVAFGDPHAFDPSGGCPKHEGVEGREGIVPAINSMADGSHLWPGGKGFSRGGEPFDSPRGVLIAGDLTTTGSQSRPAGLRQCREYSAYRDLFGRCGDEGKLLFPVYEGYGNHDFPFVASIGDPAFHPVVDYLDRLTKEHRPGPEADLYDDNDGSTGHYAWRWDDIWFVNLDLKPGTKHEVIPRGAGTRIPSPHDSLEFLKEFLKKLPARSQIVIMSHYPMTTIRLDDSDRKAFCAIIHNAQQGAAPRLAKNNPIVAFLHGHNHHEPEYKPYQCPPPYQTIKFNMFSVGTPLPGNKNNDNNLQFTIFRIDESALEAVGVRAPKEAPTGAWGSTFGHRFEIMNAPK